MEKFVAMENVLPWLLTSCWGHLLGTVASMEICSTGSLVHDN